MQSKDHNDRMSTLRLALLLLGTAAVVGGVYKLYKHYFTVNDN